MSFFQDKVVVITGGSDGIGKALIEALIPLGAKVATCGRNHDKLYTLQMEYSRVMLHVVACDVSDEYTRAARAYWKDAGIEESWLARLQPREHLAFRARLPFQSRNKVGDPGASGDDQSLRFISGTVGGYDDAARSRLPTKDTLARVNLAGWGERLDGVTRDPGGFVRTRSGIVAPIYCSSLWPESGLELPRCSFEFPDTVQGGRDRRPLMTSKYGRWSIGG